jgi:hypothetical protein
MSSILAKIPGWGRIGNILQAVGTFGYTIPVYPILAWILYEISGGTVSLYGLPGDPEPIWIGLAVGVPILIASLVLVTLYRYDPALGISAEGITLSSWFRNWTVPWSRTRFVAANKVWIRDALGIPSRHILTRPQAERAREFREAAGVAADQAAKTMVSAP